VIHATTKPSRAETRFDGAVVTWRIGRRGGVGCMGNCLMHGDETLHGLCTAMGGSLASTRDIGGIFKKSAVILSSTRRRRPWVLACTRPKTCNQHGLSHENGSGRDDVEGGRELGWFHGRRRPFLTWGLHGQIQHRGGLWCALLFQYDRDLLHGGGSYDHIR